jgi:hypothetical protein
MNQFDVFLMSVKELEELKKEKEGIYTPASCHVVLLP